MNTLVWNLLFLGNMTLWSVDFNLDLEIDDYCSSFLFVISLNLWVLMVEMLG